MQREVDLQHSLLQSSQRSRFTRLGSKTMLEKPKLANIEEQVDFIELDPDEVLETMGSKSQSVGGKGSYK